MVSPGGEYTARLSLLQPRRASTRIHLRSGDAGVEVRGVAGREDRRPGDARDPSEPHVAMDDPGSEALAVRGQGRAVGRRPERREPDDLISGRKVDRRGAVVVVGRRSVEAPGRRETCAGGIPRRVAAEGVDRAHQGTAVGVLASGGPVVRLAVAGARRASAGVGGADRHRDRRDARDHERRHRRPGRPNRLDHRAVGEADDGGSQRWEWCRASDLSGPAWPRLVLPGPLLVLCWSSRWTAEWSDSGTRGLGPVARKRLEPRRLGPTNGIKQG